MRNRRIQDRTAARHGFYLNQAEPLAPVVAGKPKGRGGSVSPNQLLRADPTQPEYAVGHAHLVRQLRQLVFQWPVPNDQEPAGHQGQRPNRVVQPLVIHQPAHGQPQGPAVFGLEPAGMLERRRDRPHVGAQINAQGQNTQLLAVPLQGGRTFRIRGRV